LNLNSSSGGTYAIGSITTNIYNNSGQVSINVILDKGGDKNGKGGGKPQGKK
jgi:hypothetical protein